MRYYTSEVRLASLSYHAYRNVPIYEESFLLTFDFVDGISYAFSTLVLEGKEVQELGRSLRPYIHLQNLNLNSNKI